ncbi:MAG: RepB family plasmid replication initiator protein [Saprospiraceae bacterium]|nr:RepB family plasmid replication initiator protein [Saprospiraceae bacterium]
MEKQNQDKKMRIEAAYSGNLSFEELMILGKLYAIVKPTDLDFCDYVLSFNSLTFPFSSLSEAAISLLNRPIRWFDDQEDLNQNNVLASVKISQKADSQIIAKIPPSVKNAFLNVKSQRNPFAFLNLPFLQLNTSMRLYTLILQNTLQDWGSCVISLDKLKTELNVSDKYALYANFKIKILEEAQKRIASELNQKFDFSEVKTGHKVTAVRFRIEKHPFLELLDNDEMPDNLQTYLSQPEPEIPFAIPIEKPQKATVNGHLAQKIAERLGVVPRMVKKLAEDYSEDVLEKALLITEKAIEKKTIKGSAAGFFVEAVRQNYQLSEEDEQAKRQAEARQKAEQLAKIEAEERQRRDNQKKQEFEQERNAILEEVIRDATLRQTITERIRYSIFHACYDLSKTFTENLENPSFLAAVLNYYKIVKK